MSDPIVNAVSAATSSPAGVVDTTTVINGARSMIVSIHGHNLNLMSLIIFVVLLGVLFMFYKIQKSERLDFADMITKDGRAVSLTKVLQLIGGITATWIMIKLTLMGGLSEALFGLYLTYVGAIEGYSKFVAAKYGYQEKSVKEAGADDEAAAAAEAEAAALQLKVKKPAES